jgi:endoglucanase
MSSHNRFFLVPALIAGLVACAMPAGLSAARQVPLSNLTGLENVSSVEVVRRMGLGINLGNTMEACGDWIKGNEVRNFETAWGQPETTREIIQGFKKAGFRSVRIPVAWSNLVGDDFTINPALMARVRQIVDWVLEADMVAVVNIHWDGGWWSKFPKEHDATMKRYLRLWSQIADAFKDYPATLIFESLNEEGCFGDIWNQWGGETHTQDLKVKAFDVLNGINQNFVDLVRKSGGMNAKRHLLIAGYCTDIGLTTSPEFRMPNDPANHCIVSVHYYTPPTFAILEADAGWGKCRSTWGTPEDIEELEKNLGLLKTRFLDQGIPVIVGEYGTVQKNKKPESVRLYILTVAEKCYRMGICPMLWDCSGFYVRRELGFNDPKIGQGFQKILKMKRD